MVTLCLYYVYRMCIVCLYCVYSRCIL